MNPSKSIFDMFSGLRASADDLSDCESDTAVMVNGLKLIRGENGTYMLSSSGDALLDLFSASTRLDATKLDASEVERFLAKLNACLEFDDADKTEAIMYFCAHAFYLRDIKEKGERTLFDLTFIRIWKFDPELAKLLMKFIVGSDDADYFGSWKDLKQILVLAKTDSLGLSELEYDHMYRHFLRFECEQLSKDWAEYVACKRSDGPKAGTKADLSLCAKWTVGAGKHFDDELEHLGKSYVANSCEINADLLAEMTKLAHDAKIGEIHLGAAHGPTNRWKRKVKPTDYLGLQRVLRLVKSALNAELDTPERKMCQNKWSAITITSVPARNMSKHRRAFNNEKATRDRKAGQLDEYSHPYGDRKTVPDDFRAIVPLLNSLKDQIALPDFAAKVAEFWANDLVRELPRFSDVRKVLDRIICRLNVCSAMIPPTSEDEPKKSIHGARSDLSDLVKAAWQINCGPINPSFDPAKITEWAGSYPDRALVHVQVQDKLNEIRKAIEAAKAKAVASIAAADADESHPTYASVAGGSAAIPASTKEITIDFTKAICLADTSGSMESAHGAGSVKPIDISVGLAYFLALLCWDKDSGRLPVGITFDSEPRMYDIPMNLDFVGAINHIKRSTWDGRSGSTNFTAAFRLILNHATKNKLTQEQMPSCLIVVSDMQFDVAENGAGVRFETMYETLKREFEAAGYELPLLVFWNVNAAYAGQSAGASGRGVITLSGYDPALFKTLSECGSLGTKDLASGKVTMVSPKEAMIKALSRERYQPILDLVEKYYDVEQEDVEQEDVALVASASVSASNYVAGS
jgi:hypothetical protein